MATFDLTMPEAWYPVPNFPGYEISSHFRIRSLLKYRSNSPPGRIKRTYKVANGYLAVSLRRDRRNLPVLIHHIVAELVLGPRPAGMNVLHRDDNKTNNQPSNLYYGTQSQNFRDAIRNGKVKTGQDASQAKLTDEQVREIRSSLAVGVPRLELADRFHVNPSTINLIAWGKRWKHLI